MVDDDILKQIKKIFPKKYYLEVTENEEEESIVFPLTQDILVALGWKEGDTLCWEIAPNNTITLRKSNVQSK